MIILQLEIRNIGPLDDVNIQLPESGIIEITGKNEAGKTTVLKAIKYLLSGYGKHDGDILAHGKEAGEMILYLGESSDRSGLVMSDPGNYKYKIVRTINKLQNTKLTVYGNENQVYSSPQTLLNTFINDLAINPQQFCSMPDKDQVETLLKGFDIKLDLGELQTVIMDEFNLNLLPDVQKNLSDPFKTIEIVREKIYDQRKMLKKLYNQTETKIDALIIPVKPDIIKPRQSKDLLEQRQKMQNEADEQTKSKAALLEMISSKESLINEIAELEETIRLKRKNLKLMEDKCGDQNEYISMLPEIDFADIDKQIAEIDIWNTKAQESMILQSKYEMAVNQQNELLSEKESLKNNIERQEILLTNIADFKKKFINNIKLPLTKLSFNEDGVITYEGELLSARGQSLQHMLACRILAAMNPRLKTVIFLQEVQLDKEHQEKLDIWAKKEGYQILTCRVVDEKNDNVFYIEDGKLNNNY